MIDIIAEWGQSCRGDLAVAVKQAEAAKRAGCTYAKWQIFAPERIAGKGAKRYWDPTLGGSESQLETFRKNGMLAPDDWKELKDACDDLHINFLATPFDLEGVDLLESIDVDAYKVASGDITYKPLLKLIAGTGKPVFLSTGASYVDEIALALDWLQPCPVTLLVCSLTYPCPAHDANVARIDSLSQVFDNQIGYSDHTREIETALAATAAGAVVLEKHCTLGEDGVPDDRMALNPEQLGKYVMLAHLGYQMRGGGLIGPMKSEMPARAGARRSLHVTRTITAGERFRQGDFAYLRPEGPFEPLDEEELIGRKAKRNIAEGAQIQNGDVG